MNSKIQIIIIKAYYFTYVIAFDYITKVTPTTCSFMQFIAS